MRLVLALFIILPIVEMWILIEVGQWIGAPLTIAAVLATALAGAALLRREGSSTLARANERLGRGELPANEMLEGIALAIGGALLLTPGFVTDAVGFACLLPFTRRPVVAWLLRNLPMQIISASTMSTSFSEPPQRDGPGVIEGEFERKDD